VWRSRDLRMTLKDSPDAALPAVAMDNCNTYIQSPTLRRRQALPQRLAGATGFEMAEPLTASPSSRSAAFWQLVCFRRKSLINTSESAARASQGADRVARTAGGLWGGVDETFPRTPWVAPSPATAKTRPTCKLGVIHSALVPARRGSECDVGGHHRSQRADIAKCPRTPLSPPSALR
jgi:hypothetical protein